MAEKKARKKRTPTPEARTAADHDELLAVAEENWPHIMQLYRLFADRNPIMLYDLQEQRVYAYPYAEFAAELNERSQRSLAEQYERAVREGKVVVFVRDNERRRFVSFSLAPVG